MLEAGKYKVKRKEKKARSSSQTFMQAKFAVF